MARGKTPDWGEVGVHELQVTDLILRIALRHIEGRDVIRTTSSIMQRSLQHEESRRRP